jgi:hypothetical protein
MLYAGVFVTVVVGVAAAGVAEAEAEAEDAGEDVGEDVRADGSFISGAVWPGIASSRRAKASKRVEKMGLKNGWEKR